ncbi:hypothetical protein [Microvirga sp. Mcv34]|uniref:hypothetical protein n=1 Tax=Microvirga sp. Mcv34 TaxID=2926016 RepID=UPI0021C6DD90|nr:hypothetical protein [Microvirga sp. Mcv34]
MRKLILSSTLAAAGALLSLPAASSEAVIQQMPPVVSGVIKQIDAARLFQESIETIPAVATTSSNPSGSFSQEGNAAQIVQHGVNNQAAILQSGGGSTASILQNGRGNAAFVIQKR